MIDSVMITIELTSYVFSRSLAVHALSSSLSSELAFCVARRLSASSSSTDVVTTSCAVLRFVAYMLSSEMLRA